MEMGAKAVGKLFDALDAMSPTQVPIPAGIAIDKALRLLEVERGGFVANAQNIQINFIAQKDPRLEDVVEGEVIGDEPA